MAPRDDLTLVEVLVQLRRVSSSTGALYDVDALKQGEEYLKTFRSSRVRLAEIVDAIDHGLKTWRKFPSAAEIIAIARNRRYIHKPAEPAEGNVCAFCKGERFAAGYEAAIGVFLKVRCACPRPEPGWWTPAALACVETDPRMTQPPADYATNPVYRTGRRDAEPELFA